jgi:Na+/melibiose symporter-like transporter
VENGASALRYRAGKGLTHLIDIPTTIAISSIIFFYLVTYLLARNWKKSLKVSMVTDEEASRKKAELLKEQKEHWRPFRYNLAYALQYLGQGFVRMAFVFFLPIYIAQELGYPQAAIPALIALITLAWTIKWPWGVLTDAVPWGRFGRRKPYIILFTTIAVIALAVFGFTPINFSIVIALSILFLALLSGIDAAYDGLLLDIIPSDYHGFTIGGVAWGFKALGELISSLATATVIALYGFSAAFLMALLFQLLSYSCLLIHEPTITMEKRVSKESFSRLFTDKYLWVGFLALSLPSYLAFYSPTAGALGFVLKNVVKATTLIGTIGAMNRGACIVGSLLGGFISDKIGHKKTAIIGGSLMGITIFAWIFASPETVNYVFILATIMGIIEGFSISGTFAICGDLCPPYMPGTNFQVFMSAGHIGAYIMLLVWSSVLASYSWVWGIITIAILGAIYLIPLSFIKPVREAKAQKV